MAKRRKLSEIWEEVQKINNQKPTEEDLRELAKVLAEIEDKHDVKSNS